MKIMRGKQSPVQPRKQAGDVSSIIHDDAFMSGVKSGVGYAVATTIVTAVLNTAVAAMTKGVRK